MIDTVVFDIGQVLAQFRWQELIRDMGCTGETARALGEATVRSPWWPKVDLGAPQEEYEAGMKADHPELTALIEQFFSRSLELTREYPYSLPLIEDLHRKGIKVYLLSNYGDHLFHEANPTWRFFPHVDGMVISYELGIVKPDPRIYRALLERYQITPEHAVFLDDVPENAEGARKVGMHAIHFTDLPSALKELHALGV